MSYEFIYLILTDFFSGGVGVVKTRESTLENTPQIVRNVLIA